MSGVFGRAAANWRFRLRAAITFWLVYACCNQERTLESIIRRFSEP